MSYINKYSPAIIIGLVCLSFLTFCYWQKQEWVPYTQHWNPGVMGDTFGSFTSLLTLLAFIGIVLTYRKESKQLEILLAERAQAEEESLESAHRSEQQIQLLIDERRDSRRDAVRVQIADSYRVMLETKKLLLDVARNELRSHSEFGYVDFSVNYTRIREPLYEIQNAWIESSMQYVRQQPELTHIVRDSLYHLIVSMPDIEREQYVYVMSKFTPTLAVCINSMIVEPKYHKLFNDYLANLTDVKRKEQKLHIERAEDMMTPVFDLHKQFYMSFQLIEKSI